MKRPKDTRYLSYRNLNPYRGTVWYRRKVGARLYRVNTRYQPDAEGWKLAAQFRDEYEKRKRIGEDDTPRGAVPTFAAFAQRYLDEDTHHLAPRTRLDRKRYLGADGLLLPHLGAKRLDAITPVTLREWWTLAIDTPGRSRRTGDNHVNTLAAIFAYARELALVRDNPVDELRQQLKRRRRTKQGRAAARPMPTPIERPEEMARLVDAARAEGARTYAALLCLLDTGMRMGELVGLEWRQVVQSDGPDRHVYIDGNVPAGTSEREETKSGRARKVPLSRRLRAALLEWYVAQGRPEEDARVFPGFNPDSFRRNAWARLCRKAKLGARKPKDLRDTFASHLLVATGQLPYVSRLLGHGSIQLTEQRYARWVADGYVEPMRLEPGEVVTDLLSRLEWSQGWSQNTEERQGTA